MITKKELKRDLIKALNGWQINFDAVRSEYETFSSKKEFDTEQRAISRLKNKYNQ